MLTTFFNKALSQECRIGQRMGNELCLTHEERMTLTMKKNNTYKRTLPNDEHPFKDQTFMKRIFDGCQWMPKMVFVPYA